MDKVEKVKTFPSKTLSSAPSTAPSTTPSAQSVMSTPPLSQTALQTPPNVATKNSLVSQMTQARSAARTLPVAVKTKFTSVFYAGLTFFLLLLGGSLTTLFIILAKRKNKNKTIKVPKNKNKNKKSPHFNLQLNHPESVPESVPASVPVESASSVPDLTKDLNGWEGEDPDPNSPKKDEKKVTFDKEKPEKEKEKQDKPKGFPSLQEAKNSKEDSFAKQYSYENIHDSMYNRPRAKPSFSKLGGTSDNWESDVSLIKKEIESSGQTLEQFMDTTMAPIPEALADAWKASAYMPKKRYEMNTNVPKYAQKEMPSLVSDVTQSIPMDGKEIAFRAMEDILKAKKRAKVLGVELPKLTSVQMESLDKWSKSEENSLSSLASSLKSMN